MKLAHYVPAPKQENWDENSSLWPPPSVPVTKNMLCRMPCKIQMLEVAELDKPGVVACNPCTQATEARRLWVILGYRARNKKTN